MYYFKFGCVYTVIILIISISIYLDCYALNQSDDGLTAFDNLILEINNNPDTLKSVLKDTSFVHSQKREFFNEDFINCLVRQLKFLKYLGFKYDNLFRTNYDVDLQYIINLNRDDLVATNYSISFKLEFGKFKISLFDFSEIFKKKELK